MVEKTLGAIRNGASLIRLEAEFTGIQRINNGRCRTLKRCCMTRHSLSWHLPKRTRQHTIRNFRRTAEEIISYVFRYSMVP